MLFVGDIKDTSSLTCFIDIIYERWGILYGTNPRYAVITAETIYIKDNARYKAFMTDYEDTVGKIFEAAKKFYNDNKVQAEKTRLIYLFAAWHFAKNTLGKFVGA